MTNIKLLNNKKVKLGIFIDGEFIPSNSGAANRFHYMSRYLSKNKDIEVVIFLGDRGWSDISLISKEKFKTYVFNHKDYYDDFEKIIQIVKEENINVVQFDSIEQVLSQGFKIKKSLGIPVILEAHYDFVDFAENTNLTKEKILEKKKDLLLAKKVIDGIIALSGDELLKFKTSFKFNDNQIKVIPSGVDFSEIKPNQVNYDSKKCIFLGNLYFYPNEVGLDFIYNKIYKELVKKDYTFVIAGDAPERIVKKYTNKNFKFIGQINNLNDLFNDSLCALIPIFHGPGMRIKLLNYAAAGIPVLTTKEGAEGFPCKKLLKIIDSKDFVKQIDLIKTNKTKWKKETHKLYSYIKINLSWLKLSKKAVMFYRDIIKERSNKKIINHNDYVSKNSSPSWLIEISKKGRFKNQKPTVKKGFYLVVDKGNIKEKVLL